MNKKQLERVTDKASEIRKRIKCEQPAALSRPVVPDGDGWMPIESAPLGDFLVSVHGWVTAAYRNDGEPIKSMSLHEPFMFSPTRWRPFPAPPAARSAAQEK